MRIGASHTELIHAPIGPCFGVLTDFAAYPQWWPGCTRADVVADGGGGGIQDVKLVFDTDSPIGLIDCHLRFHIAAPTNVRPERLGGRLTSLTGEGWRLASEGPHTLAHYQVEAQMDTGLPGLLERRFRGKAAELLVVAPVKALKQRVESALAQ
jgi:hypothetical protein